MDAPRTPSSSSATEIILSRRFAAPRDQVFRAWTDPAQLTRWWGPEGWTTPVCRVDLRPGGLFHFCMRSPEGIDFWGRGVYREVSGDRLAYVDSFADAEGRLAPPEQFGMSAGFPSEALVTVTFADVAGGTAVTLRHALPASVAERTDTEAGWGQMFDRLARLLAAGAPTT